MMVFNFTIHAVKNEYSLAFDKGGAMRYGFLKIHLDKIFIFVYFY